MPLEAPNLDDRRFNELFEEMRALIPRYAPEWTDHNLSDPGITLMQLFAWLGETILYRLNRVPERNYIKFLQLLGVEQKPAAPAKAELTFTLTSPDLSTVVIPQGTQVSAEVVSPPPSAVVPSVLPPEPEEEPVVFETDEPLIAIGAALQAVQVDDGVNFRLETDANRNTDQHYFPLGRRPRDGNALLLGFASNNPFPTDEINLTIRIHQDRDDIHEHVCDPFELNLRPPATVVWEYWNGSDWRQLEILKDETRALTRSGHVYFRGPSAIIKDRMGAVTDEQLYWIRCHLVESQYERPPRLAAVLTNTVRAIALTTIQDEVVGASNGEPNQVFRLRNAPIHAEPPRPTEERLREREARARPPTEAEQERLDNALRANEPRRGFLLEVDEGQGPKPWERVEDFFTSEPDDRHYTLEATTGTIRFGNGQQGRIPLAGIENMIARYYRYGGGTRGNVGKETITELQTVVPPEVDSVTNQWPAEGGADEEPVEDTKARAPKELKARDRAVTEQDFEFLARQTPGVRVRRAHALSLYHPQFPDVQVPGVVTVIIVPESDEPNPVPNEATMEAVCQYLNQRRLVTTEVLVAPPQYKHVAVEAVILAHPNANPAVVKTNVETALNDYLHPLIGGGDGQGWPLGGDVLYSEVFRVALQVEGVQRIESLHLIVDGERLGRCEDAPIPRDFLVFSDRHTINVMFTSSP
jgi:hypothetical protein